MHNKLKYLILALFTLFSSIAQEGVPVYSDYLTDNYYLLHPSMAGAANCDKLRITGRKQWLGQTDAPELQTLSYNAKIGENLGAGVVMFNDKNGYHSQKGIKLTYAYHLMFSRDAIDLNQLSFGISPTFIQSQLDQTSFRLEGGIPDKVVSIGQVSKSNYFNLDFGLSYNFLDFYAHLTIANVMPTRRALYTEFENDNLKKYILSIGQVYGDKETIIWEPSFLFQYVDKTKEKWVDFNIKAYKEIPSGTLWGGLSYRRSFETAKYTTSTGNVSNQALQYVTPFIGFNYSRYMFSYTYSQVVGGALFSPGGYHQITLGVNVFCRPVPYECKCPHIN